MPEPRTKTTTAPELAAPCPVQAAVETWGTDLLRNLGPVIATEAYNHLHAAIGDLKARLAAIPKEG